jgi:hypothetical protein
MKNILLKMKNPSLGFNFKQLLQIIGEKPIRRIFALRFVLRFLLNPGCQKTLSSKQNNKAENIAFLPISFHLSKNITLTPFGFWKRQKLLSPDMAFRR